MTNGRATAAFLATTLILSGCGGGGSGAALEPSVTAPPPSAGTTAKAFAVVAATPAPQVPSLSTEGVWRMTSNHIEDAAPASNSPVTASSGGKAFFAWFSGERRNEQLNLASYDQATGWSVTPVTTPAGSDYGFNIQQIALGTNANGQAVAAWAEADLGSARDRGTVTKWQVRVSRFENDVWTQPETVGESGRDIEQVRAGYQRNGTPVVAWLSHQYAQTVDVVLASNLSVSVRDATATWRVSTAKSVPSGEISETGLVSGDSSSHIAWIEKIGQVATLNVAKINSGTVEGPNRVIDAPDGLLNGLQLSAMPSEAVIAVWRQRRCDVAAYTTLPTLTDEWAKARDQQLCSTIGAGRSWPVALVGASAGGYGVHFLASIAVQPSGKALVAWSEGLPARRRIWVNTRASEAWGTQTELNTAETLTASSVSTAALDDDRYAVSWVTAGELNTTTPWFQHVAIATLDASGRGKWVSDKVAKTPYRPALARAGKALILTWRAPTFVRDLFAQDVSGL